MDIFLVRKVSALRPRRVCVLENTERWCSHKNNRRRPVAPTYSAKVCSKRQLLPFVPTTSISIDIIPTTSRKPKLQQYISPAVYSTRYATPTNKCRIVEYRYSLLAAWPSRWVTTPPPAQTRYYVLALYCPHSTPSSLPPNACFAFRASRSAGLGRKGIRLFLARAVPRGN